MDFMSGPSWKRERLNTKEYRCNVRTYADVDRAGILKYLGNVLQL